MSAPSGAPDAGAPQGSDDAADEGQSAVAAPAYPLAWEADVLLADGGTAHLRPIRPDDADRLVEMHGRLSAQTIYYRFFAPTPASARPTSSASPSSTTTGASPSSPC